MIFMVRLLVCVLLAGCASSSLPLQNYGIVEQHLGFIPAKIAVLPCATWPASIPMTAAPMQNAAPEVLKTLCVRVDQAVTNAFSRQPYMRGYSAKGVLKMLEAAQKPQLATDWVKLWSYEPKECANCSNEPSAYVVRVSERPQWRAWLGELASTVKQCDAVLLPFVSYAQEKQFDDHGLLRSVRSAGVALLLIDTNNGELLWSGGRKSTLSNQVLVGQNPASFPAYPEWEALNEGLFAEDLWRQFPGRLVY